MAILDHLLPDFPADQRDERKRLISLMGMFFLVVTAVGILKPVKNALALAGLGDNDFYQAYLVSAAVLLFVPVYNRLADRVGWRTLVPAVAIFFATNLLLFRLAYREGSTLLGLTFYGWYDLFGAALVTQFFMATQKFLTARTARSAYPLVIGGGAVGAVFGALISATLADVIGTANLLLVAAAFILMFGIGITFAWPVEETSAFERERAKGVHRREKVSRGDLSRVLGNAHVRLIAVSVLLAILVKQLVDYQFNTLTERWLGEPDAITKFQAQVSAVTQWLPLVSVVALRPLLRRWGVSLAVFLLPVLMLSAGLVMAAFFSIWTVIVVRASDTAFRYSAERAGREILYVPVPEDIKLKAKTYIDVGIEKGLGKALSAGVLFVLVETLRLELHEVAYVVVGLAVAWVMVTVAIRQEYVRTLAGSIRGRFASFEGLSALADASTQGVVRRALEGRDAVQTSFALDLVDQSAGAETHRISSALHGLLDHDSQDIRRKALAILARDPANLDPEQVRKRLHDSARGVREAAVRALVAGQTDKAALIRELLLSEQTHVRTATLACLSRGQLEGADGQLLGQAYLEELWDRAQAGDRDARIELALAAGALRTDPLAGELLEPLVGDPDPTVASAALQSAGMLRRRDLYPAMIAALRSPSTREAAREALAEQGGLAVDALAACLLDERGHAVIRRHIPSVLARIADQRAVDVLLHSVVAPETDQLLDFRTLKAMTKLRYRDPMLVFDPEEVLQSVEREVRAAQHYDRARRCLRRVGASGRSSRLLDRALDEAWLERQEGVFRLMGLLYDPDEMYRCHLALATGDRAARGNAMEWLEETLGRSLFEDLGPIVGDPAPEPVLPTPERDLSPLLADGDPWIARLALATVGELDAAWSRKAVSDIIESGSQPELRDLARRLLRGAPLDHRGGHRPMDLIEKVFLLQKIDLLQDARSAHLALLASIAEDVDVDRGTVLIRQDEATDALYVVIEGEVELEGVGDQRMELAAGQAFGTWALIDEAPSLMTARTRTAARLLRITRADFYDLLADHSELALGLLQGLARRVRTLVA
ncbi:MAG TPA: Npt1/Npt2 family nucleotide transporter [Longimicrobiales bacterium]|nr:Npt1/Npt2 family nucleotide transporter [Longimicrobiales bacterium]